MRGFIDGSLYIERLIYYPTLRCSLKCELCSAYSPYYKNPYHPDVKQLCEELERLFAIADYVELIEIVGGEPMIRKDLYLVLSKLYGHVSQIGKIRITTNGTILPDSDFIREAQRLGNKFFVLIDDYGPELSKRAGELYHILTEAGIGAEIRDNYRNAYGGGWWDLGDFSLLWNDEEAKELYQKCVIGKSIRTMNYIQGKIYQCATHRRAVELRVVPEDQAEVIDLFAPLSTREELRKRIADVYELELLSACKYCPGRLREAKRYPPAIQISEKHQREAEENCGE